MRSGSSDPATADLRHARGLAEGRRAPPDPPDRRDRGRAGAGDEPGPGRGRDRDRLRQSSRAGGRGPRRDGRARPRRRRPARRRDHRARRRRAADVRHRPRPQHDRADGDRRAGDRFRTAPHRRRSDLGRALWHEPARRAAPGGPGLHRVRALQGRDAGGLRRRARQERGMFVGEQPGDREDREGQPFVGPAGRVLDRALARPASTAGSPTSPTRSSISATSSAASGASISGRARSTSAPAGRGSTPSSRSSGRACWSASARSPRRHCSAARSR